MYAIHTGFYYFFSDWVSKTHVSNMVMWQEGIIRAQLHKILNGTKDIIYEEAHASEEGFKAVSCLADTFCPEKVVVFSL